MTLAPPDPQPSNAACPRCASPIVCGAESGAPVCACFAARLTPALRARLEREYVGCLCLACLQSLAAESEA